MDKIFCCSSDISFAVFDVFTEKLLSILLRFRVGVGESKVANDDTSEQESIPSRLIAFKFGLYRAKQRSISTLIRLMEPSAKPMTIF
ncbi:hypothetical protein DERP_012897 [Dermatophagoides pteronyssinus]|uniref:Uncharacterized protein n=1 Tax=Dermatophagoides pteronyssinus TaxID=6956 RepID=A0ABQ8J1R0_DERPT|nr:hypothetical protein DERP_012897 [Dermatophagoides pteronyssinus]